jgi:hypothetical protein
MLQHYAITQKGNVALMLYRSIAQVGGPFLHVRVYVGQLYLTSVHLVTNPRPQAITIAITMRSYNDFITLE